jgi:hypothetical protein
MNALLHRWRRQLVAGALFALAAGAVGSGVAVTAAADRSGAPNFGPNVYIFDPSMPQSTIQATLNTISTQQVPVGSQFDSQRYAIFFEPGTYGSSASPLVFQVGYYEQVAGLGAMPQDVVINGQIDAFANALDCPNGPTGYCWDNSTVNFWRSLSNLELNVIGDPAALNSPPLAQAAPPISNPGAANCYGGNNDFWSVSQAAPLRRLLVNGNIVFQAFCTAKNYGGTDFASGGFLANDKVTGNLDFYGNQQYMVRNSQIGGSAGCPQGLWDNVFAGVVGAPAEIFTGSCHQNTVLPTSPVTEEQPFLYTDSDGNWNVFISALQHDSIGPNFLTGSEAGTSVALQHFFVASPDTSVAEINNQLALGRNLILTPGIYDLDQPIVVTRPGTVVMGLGFATLVPQNGTAAMTVDSNIGVKLSGLIIDAGPVNSSVLLSVGSTTGPSSPGNPDLISDVFFRIGGAETTSVSATVSLVDNASNSIIDDVWAWRADHGNAVGWTANTADTGVIVNGDNVTAYGLAVEHYQKYEVVWNGNGGTDIFFQNELPYDPPDQASWMATPTQDGYPSFEVGPSVTTFNGYGMGSYVVFIQTAATLYDAEAFQAPTMPAVQFHDVLTVWIAGSGGDLSVIDGVGGPDTSTDPGIVVPVDVVSYP